MQRRSARSTCSPMCRTSATPSPSCSTATGSTTPRCAGIARWTNLSETTFVLPADAARRRLPGPHLHAERRAALRRPPDARHVPRLAGGRRASRRPATTSCRSARPGSCGSAAPTAASRSPRRRCVRSGPGRRRARRPSSRRRSASTRRRSSTPSGSTTGRAGSPSCSTRSAACRPATPRPGVDDGKLGLVALAPAGRTPHAIEVRAFFPKDGMLAEDPVTGSLNASRRPVAARLRARSPRPTSPARARALGRAGRVHVDHRRRRHDLDRRRHRHVHRPARSSAVRPRRAQLPVAGVARPVRLEHVPLLGGPADQVLELVGEGLGDPGDVVAQRPAALDRRAAGGRPRGGR